MAQETEMVLRAWRDPAYKESLPDDVRSAIPERPDDFDSLSDDQLEQAAGGTTPAVVGAVGGIAAAAGGVMSAIDAVNDDAGVQGD